MKSLVKAILMKLNKIIGKRLTTFIISKYFKKD